MAINQFGLENNSDNIIYYDANGERSTFEIKDIPSNDIVSDADKPKDIFAVGEVSKFNITVERQWSYNALLESFYRPGAELLTQLQSKASDVQRVASQLQPQFQKAKKLEGLTPEFNQIFKFVDQAKAKRQATVQFLAELERQALLLPKVQTEGEEQTRQLRLMDYRVQFRELSDERKAMALDANYSNLELITAVDVAIMPMVRADLMSKAKQSYVDSNYPILGQLAKYNGEINKYFNARLSEYLDKVDTILSKNGLTKDDFKLIK